MLTPSSSCARFSSGWSVSPAARHANASRTSSRPSAQRGDHAGLDGPIFATLFLGSRISPDHAASFRSRRVETVNTCHPVTVGDGTCLTTSFQSRRPDPSPRREHRLQRLPRLASGSRTTASCRASSPSVESGSPSRSDHRPGACVHRGPVRVRGNVTKLVPLYTRVFLAFTLSQSGLVGAGVACGSRWRLSIVITALHSRHRDRPCCRRGHEVQLGAWMVLIVLPSSSGALCGNRHYTTVHDALTLDGRRAHSVLKPPVVIIPVARLDRATLQAVASLADLADCASRAHRFTHESAEEFAHAGAAGRPRCRRVIESPYRSLLQPLLRYIERIDERDDVRSRSSSRSSCRATGGSGSFTAIHRCGSALAAVPSEHDRYRHSLSHGRHGRRQSTTEDSSQ